MALLTASMSLRRTRAHHVIGMSSESIASSIHASSVPISCAEDAVEAHRQASHLGERVRCLQGIDLSCLPVC